MTISISSDDPRSIKAIEIAAGAGQWLKCHTADGRKAYGVPSQHTPGRYYLTDCQSCTCPDFQQHGLSEGRVGRPGSHVLCKHILAVRLHCELSRVQQARPASRRDRSHLRLIATAARYDEIFKRFGED